MTEIGVAGVQVRRNSVFGSSSLAMVLFAGLLGFVLFSPVMAYQGEEALNGQGNLLRQVVYSTICILSVSNALAERPPRTLAVMSWPVVLVLAWGLASMAWSVDPAAGARRLFLTGMIVWSVFLLIRQTTYLQIRQSARWVLGVVLLANIVAVVAVPQIGIHQLATEEDPSIVGAWRGVLGQKNFAGAASAFTIILFLLDGRGVGRALRWSIVIASAAFLLGTQSKTSAGWLLAAFVCGLAAQYYEKRHRLIIIILGTFAVALVSLLININWDILAAPFYRQDFLTGRTQIWPYMYDYWQDHPWGGSGFGSFWNVRDPQPILQYTHGWISKIASGHNGYLDLLVAIGLPGLVLALNAVIFEPAAYFLARPLSDRREAAVVVAMLCFALGHNFTESSLFDRDATVCVFVMISIALIHRPGDRAGGETT